MSSNNAFAHRFQSLTLCVTQTEEAVYDMHAPPTQSSEAIPKAIVEASSAEDIKKVKLDTPCSLFKEQLEDGVRYYCTPDKGAVRIAATGTVSIKICNVSGNRGQFIGEETCDQRFPEYIPGILTVNDVPGSRAASVAMDGTKAILAPVFDEEGITRLSIAAARLSCALALGWRAGGRRRPAGPR